MKTNFRFINYFKYHWGHLCYATKTLFFIGIISFISTTTTIFLEADASKPSDIAIRALMSSVFGFLFGDKIMPNDNIKNKDFQTAVASVIAFLAIAVVIATQWCDVQQNSAALVEIRNLLFTSVGFLISRARTIETCPCSRGKSSIENTLEKPIEISKDHSNK